MQDSSPNGTPDGCQTGAGQTLQFLPINKPNSPSQSKRRRAYQSCEPCRKRKTRCVPDKPDQRQPCQRCVSDGHRCVFKSTRSVSRKPDNPRPADSSSVRRSYGSPSAPTMAVNGSRASMAHPLDHRQPLSPTSTQRGKRQGDDHRNPDEAAATTRAMHISPAESSPATSNPSARSRVISAQLHNTADALDLLTFTAASEQGRRPQRTDQVSDNLRHNPELGVGETPLVGGSGGTTPQNTADADWERFVLIKRGILAKDEAVEYLDFYFDTIWPLRPVIPPFYRDRGRYVALPLEEPLLLLSLITLASRYHALSGSHGEMRSERIHWQAWRLLQRGLQSALWGSPYTRSPGAIASMLLMIEWHTKSINNPVSFYEEEEYNIFNSQDTRRENWDTRSSHITSLTSQQRYGMATLLENLNIVAPAYRSNKMSWMLLSSAIALAQEGCCFDNDQQSASSSGVASASEKETLRQQWNQLICVFIYLADEHLTMRLGLRPLLPEVPSDAVRNRFSTTFASLLPDSALWESYYDLFTETKKSRALLQSLKKAGWPTIFNAEILPELEHIDRALCRWRRQHVSLKPSESRLLAMCLDLEYHYSVMYSFAPASYILQNSPPAELNDDKRDSLLRLSNKASQASHEILLIVINGLGPLRLTRYLPVRCWLFVVAANLHLLKSTLTVSPHVPESHGNVQLLRDSIAAIRDGSPDDTHMAVRYARFLDILLKESLHSPRAATPAREQTGWPDLGAAAASTEDANSGYSSLPPTLVLDDLAMLDFPYGPGNPGDPFRWWDGAFGMTGGMGF